MNLAFRRILPLFLGGMLLAAAAAYALQSGDILKQGIEAYRAGQYQRALDLFTQAHVTKNHASSSHDDLFGDFTTC